MWQTLISRGSVYSFQSECVKMLCRTQTLYKSTKYTSWNTCYCSADGNAYGKVVANTWVTSRTVATAPPTSYDRLNVINKCMINDWSVSVYKTLMPIYSNYLVRFCIVFSSFYNHLLLPPFHLSPGLLLSLPSSLFHTRFTAHFQLHSSNCMPSMLQAYFTNISTKFPENMCNERENSVFSTL